MNNYLKWPTEPESQPVCSWFQPGSNLCLDFHGDPAHSDLVVYSDGNHHMALAEVIDTFEKQTIGLNGIFYATTPPSVLLSIIQQGSIQMGNLVMSRQPHVFISPEGTQKKLVQLGAISTYQPFMQSQGNVLLIRKGNPKSIFNIKDLLRDDVTLFLSNPTTEVASYEVYKNSLIATGKELDIEASIKDCLDPTTGLLTYGQRIHHREAPQALFEGCADVAVVYYHLALRYSRIFPDDFEFVTLTGADMQEEMGNERTIYHLATMNKFGRFGEAFVKFCMSDAVTSIYQRHGLQRS